MTKRSATPTSPLPSPSSLFQEYRCLDVLHSHMNSWQRIAAGCGIFHTTDFLTKLLSSTPTNLQANLAVRKGSLDERVLENIILLLKTNTEALTATTMKSDSYEIEATTAQLKKEIEKKMHNGSGGGDGVSDITVIRKLMKKINALNFRYLTKEHLWNLCSKFGSTCNLMAPPPHPHSPRALEEDPLPNTCSNIGDSSSSCSLETPSSSSTAPPHLILSDLWNQSSEQRNQNLPLYLKDFNKWFNSHIHSPAKNTLIAVSIPGYRIGTITTKSLVMDEIYLALPSPVVMDLMSAEHDQIIGSLLQKLLQVFKKRDDFHVLIFHLLQEAFGYGSQSLYWNYLRLLPSPQDMDLPLFWTSEEIQSRLSPSALMNDLLLYQHRSEKNYEMISQVPLLRNLIHQKILTRETYFWAISILDSRSIWWQGQRHLVPMLDFINCQERMGERNEVIRIHATKVEKFPIDYEAIDTTPLLRVEQEERDDDEVRDEEVERIAREENGQVLKTEVMLAVTRAGTHLPPCVTKPNSLLILSLSL
jgi:hypothetical protein